VSLKDSGESASTITEPRMNLRLQKRFVNEGGGWTSWIRSRFQDPLLGSFRQGQPGWWQHSDRL